MWKKLEKLHYHRREAYGSIRLSQELQAAGEVCSRHRVARLKRTNQLWTKRRRRFVLTTKASAGHVRQPNLLKRNFVAAKPDRVWVGDVTGVWTLEGWLYLSVVLCLYSRRVVGWSMAARNDEELTMAALQMAIQMREPSAGLIFHSDRGVHYAGRRYQGLLEQYQMISSMSRTGNCYDNAVSESFFSTLKNELTLHERFHARDQARAAIFDFIEVFYNRERLHSYLGGMSPVQFEQQRVC